MKNILNLDDKSLSSEDIKILNERILCWYEVIHLHYLITRKTCRREFAIMSSNDMMRRTFRVHNTQSFQYIFRNWDIINKFKRGKGLDKFYRSVAYYIKGVPYGNPDLSTNIQSKIWLSENIKDMAGYDLFIDIDANDHLDFDRAKESMQLIHKFFLKINLPHEINFSGRGFHVIVPYEYLPKLSFDPEDKNSIYDYCLKKAKYLFDNFTELVDTCVYDSKRLMKCPYTLALYGKDLYVCKPLTNEEIIYNCKLDDFIPENVFIEQGYKLFYDLNREVKIWE